MPGTINNERAFVSHAMKFYGPGYVDHLKTKGFSSEFFLHEWAAFTDIINRHGFGPRVLDIGCGPGWSSIFLAGRGMQVTAGDVSTDMLALARENAARFNLPIEFLQINMQHPFPLNGRTFDSILILDALHHCPDERPVLRHCFDALRPGGNIFLIEPDWFHEYSPGSAHDRRVFGTTERGLSFRRLKRSIKAAGFIRPRRFYGLFSTCTASPWQRLKALTAAALTLTVGYPHRSVLTMAQRP